MGSSNELPICSALVFHKKRNIIHVLNAARQQLAAGARILTKAIVPELKIHQSA